MMPVAVLLGTGLLAAACGGASVPDDAAADRSDNVPATPTAGGLAAAAGEVLEGGVSDYLDYIGGEAGPADTSLPPIVIGWVNVEGTVNAAPEATEGAQAAVAHINAELGGVGGYPLALKTCEIAPAPTEGARCGEEMLNDDSISAVAFGNVFVGDQSFHTVLAGEKPVLISVGTGASLEAPSLATAANTFILFGDLTHVFRPWGTYARDVLGARTAALLHTDTVTDRIAGNAVREGLEDAGVTVNAVAFDSQATGLIGKATAAGVQDADMIVPIAAGEGCVGIARALTELGVTAPVVATPICLKPEVAEGLGGDLPLWTYGVAQTLSSDTTAADNNAYLEASTSAGLSEAAQSEVWAAASWSLILTYAKLMNEIGPDQINPQTVSAALTSFTGPVVLGAPQVSCDRAYTGAVQVCNDRARFYQYEGRGRFVPLTGWLRPPA